MTGGSTTGLRIIPQSAEKRRSGHLLGSIHAWLSLSAHYAGGA
jgi:hypothetical protein